MENKIFDLPFHGKGAFAQIARFMNTVGTMLNNIRWHGRGHINVTPSGIDIWVDERSNDLHFDVYINAVTEDDVITGYVAKVRGGTWTYYNTAGRNAIDASWGAGFDDISANITLSASTTTLVLLKLDTTATPNTLTVSGETSVPSYSAGIYYKKIATIVTDADGDVTSIVKDWQGGNLLSHINDDEFDPDDHSIVERDVTSGAVTLTDKAAIKNWNYEDQLPNNIISTLDAYDYLMIRPQNTDAEGEDRVTSNTADPAFIEWFAFLTELASDLVNDPGGPWNGGGPWTDASAVDHGQLAGLDDDDHDGPNHPYLHAGATGSATRNACHADMRIGDASNNASLNPNGRAAYESDGTQSLDWSSQQAHIADALTTHTIPPPADSPADADALRDDLVTYAIPYIEGKLDDLGTTVNSILAALEAYKITASS